LCACRYSPGSQRPSQSIDEISHGQQTQNPYSPGARNSDGRPTRTNALRSRARGVINTLTALRTKRQQINEDHERDRANPTPFRGRSARHRIGHAPQPTTRGPTSLSCLTWAARSALNSIVRALRITLLVNIPIFSLGMAPPTVQSLSLDCTGWPEDRGQLGPCCNWCDRFGRLGVGVAI
jgi:hypothetical protein